jgi:hypothetical protein
MKRSIMALVVTPSVSLPSLSVLSVRAADKFSIQVKASTPEDPDGSRTLIVEAPYLFQLADPAAMVELAAAEFARRQ